LSNLKEEIAEQLGQIEDKLSRDTELNQDDLYMLLIASLIEEEV